MDDNSIMPFGKYKGEKLANVPSAYLRYSFEQGWLKGDLYDYVKENLDVINMDVRSSAMQNKFNKRAYRRDLDRDNT